VLTEAAGQDPPYLKDIERLRAGFNPPHGFARPEFICRSRGDKEITSVSLRGHVTGMKVSACSTMEV